MVRLVFRPYTQIRQTICTSARLRTSTRISPGFNLPRRSSPSFGSQGLYSGAVPCLIDPGRPALLPSKEDRALLAFISRSGRSPWFQCTKTLAHALDSLIRVTRRADRDRSRQDRAPFARGFRNGLPTGCCHKPRGARSRPPEGRRCLVPRAPKAQYLGARHARSRRQVLGPAKPDRGASLHGTHQTPFPTGAGGWIRPRKDGHPRCCLDDPLSLNQ